VKQVGGSWYVSPIATGFDQLFAVSKALTRDEIEELVDEVQRFIETVEENGGFDAVPSLPGLPDYDRPGDDSAPATTVEPDEGTTVTTDEGDGSEPSVTESTVDRSLCYGEADPAAGAECFADLVSRGEIDQTDVPWWLQHIECGATEANWDVEYYPSRRRVRGPDREGGAVLPGAGGQRGRVRRRAPTGDHEP